MTAGFATPQPCATLPYCARSLSMWSARTVPPKPVCEANARKPRGTTIICSSFSRPISCVSPGKLHHRAQEALRDYRQCQQHQVDALIGLLSDITQQWQRDTDLQT